MDPRLENLINLARLSTYDHDLKEWVKEQIQSSIQPSEKEVLNCQVVDYLVDDGFPSEGVEGKYYADSDSGVVKKYEDGDWEDCGEIEDEVYYIGLDGNRLCQYGESGWEDITGGPSDSIIYVASTPESAVKMYLWNSSDSKWQDVTGQKVDNVIYIQDLSQLNNQVTDGLYSVCYSTINNAPEFYTFIVSSISRLGRGGAVNTITQVLSDMNGYKQRTKTSTSGSSGTWTAWTEYEYSYTGHSHAISDVTNLQTELIKLKKLAGGAY